MALNEAALKAALKTELDTQLAATLGLVADGGAAQLSKFTEAASAAIAKSVVDHIKASAIVVGTVTSGSGAGGAVTGAIQ